MASQLGYSEFNMNENKNNVSKSGYNRRRNKTIKKKEKKTEKVKQFLNALEKHENLESMDDDKNMADIDFNPPTTELTSQPAEVNETFVDTLVSPEGYENLNESEARNKEYYQQFVPYYNQATNNANLHGSRDELMEKLNYIVQVLEETKDEKTSNISEELVLYMFLGVFVIFVVDSFARAGKYTR